MESNSNNNSNQQFFPASFSTPSAQNQLHADYSSGYDSFNSPSNPQGHNTLGSDPATSSSVSSLSIDTTSSLNYIRSDDADLRAVLTDTDMSPEWTHTQQRLPCNGMTPHDDELEDVFLMEDIMDRGFANDHDASMRRQTLQHNSFENTTGDSLGATGYSPVLTSPSQHLRAVDSRVMPPGTASGLQRQTGWRPYSAPIDEQDEGAFILPEIRAIPLHRVRRPRPRLYIPPNSPRVPNLRQHQHPDMPDVVPEPRERACTMPSSQDIEFVGRQIRNMGDEFERVISRSVGDRPRIMSTGCSPSDNFGLPTHSGRRVSTSMVPTITTISSFPPSSVSMMDLLSYPVLNSASQARDFIRNQLATFINYTISLTSTSSSPSNTVIPPNTSQSTDINRPRSASASDVPVTTPSIIIQEAVIRITETDSQTRSETRRATLRRMHHSDSS